MLSPNTIIKQYASKSILTLTALICVDLEVAQSLL